MITTKLKMFSLLIQNLANTKFSFFCKNLHSYNSVYHVIVSILQEYLHIVKYLNKGLGGPVSVLPLFILQMEHEKTLQITTKLSEKYNSGSDFIATVQEHNKICFGGISCSTLQYHKHGKK